MNLYKIWRDIINYIFLLRQIKKESKTKAWQRFNLKIGYIGQVWCVINLKGQDMGETVEIQQAYVMERLKPIMEYLTTIRDNKNMGIEELLYAPTVGKIDGTYGWLVIFWPRWHYITRRLILKWVIALTSLFLIFNYTNAWEWITMGWNYVYEFIENSGIFKEGL